MKKKGFTLIELLAVIVILAVLALILTPMIQDLILNARKSAFERSIDGILSAAEYYQMENPSDESITFECNGISCEDSNGHKLTFKGEVPISGTVTISETGVVAENLCNSSFCGSGSRESLAINVGGGSVATSLSCNAIINSYLGKEGINDVWTYEYLSKINNKNVIIENNNIVFIYDYSGEYEEFTAPISGTYKLEVWGAEGGTYSSYTGGYGGYSTGELALEKGQTLYIAVGGKGKPATSTSETVAGGFNGGGSNKTSQWGKGSTGGGATHIATTLEGDGQLKNYDSSRDKIVIVAGGGGGGGTQNDVLAYAYGGSGGGVQGGSSKATDRDSNRINQSSYYRDVAGGSQDDGYAFGQGQSGDSWCGAGGGGWYGGYFYKNLGIGGSGGSGYIANENLNNKSMYCYDCTEDLVNQSTYTISTTGDHKDTTNCPDGVSTNPVSNCAKSGNGYVKITLMKNCDENTTAAIGEGQLFVAPKAGSYKIELWGAQGGTYNDSTTYIGGKGGYTEGIISLSKEERLYIYVGGQPSSSSTTIGGYNGGGVCTSSKDTDGRTGGGATDVRLVSGAWNNAESLASRIMVAAAGGGASYEGGNWWAVGGPAGGLTGLIAPSMGSDAQPYYGNGGTQTSGGTPHSNGPSNKIDTSINPNGTFGIGGGGSSNDGGAGGGAGYYGGSGTSFLSGGGGGSSYISGHVGCVAITSQTDTTPKTGCDNNTTDIECSYHYSGKKFTNTNIIDGASSMPTHDGTSTMTGNTGHGYAKITYLGN